VLLDTTFLLDLRHGDPDAVSLARDLDASSARQRISVISVFELYTGIVQSEGTDEHERVLAVVETKDIVPVDWPVATKAGRLHGTLVNEGNQVDVRDCLIAATALTLEEPVVTRNVGHFERFDGLILRSY
jgi:tRNA(fMet)-specific endonuclease VapC